MLASKRASPEEGNHDIDCQVPKRPRHGQSEQEETRTAVISDTMTEHLMNDIASLFQRALREELPPILQRHLSPCFGLSLNRQMGTSGGRALQLCFMNKLPPTIFTFSKIIAEDGAQLQIELCDATNQRRIVNEEVSSMKIKVCVLDADFGSDGSDNWTAEEFNANTLSPRDGKGPLLNGDTVITLKNGVGYITNKIEFSDNSSRTRTRKFRLGVKLVQSTFTDVDIKEGISEPFKVLDKRGEGYKKHEVPSLNDEVWCLKRIGKNSETRRKLGSKGIKTVKDFLQLYIINQASLKERLVERAKQEAYTNMKDLMPLETTAQTLAGVQDVQHVAADQALLQFDLPIAQQGQPETWPNLCEPTSHNEQLDFDQLQLDWLAQFISTGAYNDDDGNKWPLNGSHIDQFASYFSLPNGDGAECSNHFSFPNSTVYISSKGKRKTVWHKIRYALKWAKLHVRRRKAKQFHSQYC